MSSNNGAAHMPSLAKNQLPSGWCLTQIGNLSHVQTGGTPRRGGGDFFGGDIPWLKSGELRDGVVQTAEERLTREGLEASSAKWCPPETVCIALYGATIGRVGLLAAAATTNQAVCSIFPGPAHNSRYLFYYLWSRRQAFVFAGQGGAQSNISNGFVKEFDVPIAPFDEQTRIADRIDELFTDLDAGVAALKRVKQKLKRYRSAVLHAAVTGRLTADWRKKHGPPKEPGEKLLARILVERRKQWEQRTLAKYKQEGREPPKAWQSRYVEPAPPKTESLSELPNTWSWASVDQLGWVQLGRQRSPKNRSDKYPTKYIRAANLTERGLDLSDVMDMEFEPHELNIYRLASGDVLLSEASGSASQVGKPAVWRGEIQDCAFQNTVLRLRPVVIQSDYLHSYFLHCYKNQIFANVSRGVGINHLSADKFAKIVVAIPPLAEQVAIVEAVNEKLSQIDALEAEVARGLARAARLRQAILKAAFEGKLVPQDPNDEPAEQLLARIRAEREAAKGKPKQAKTVQRRKRTSS